MIRKLTKHSTYLKSYFVRALNLRKEGHQFLLCLIDRKLPLIVANNSPFGDLGNGFITRVYQCVIGREFDFIALDSAEKHRSNPAYQRILAETGSLQISRTASYFALTGVSPPERRHGAEMPAIGATFCLPDRPCGRQRRR